MLKINFEVASKKYEYKIMTSFALPGKGDWDWSSYVFLAHPALKEKLKLAKSKNQKIKLIRDYVDNFYDNKINNLRKRGKVFQANWSKINDKYENTICRLLELKKPRKTVTCFISMCPICPRDIKKLNFSVCYKQGLKTARSTIAHEVLHFYYFDKWKEVFPESNEEEFDGPHVIWHLSEILAVVLLNTKAPQAILKKKEKPYEEYENFKINGKTLIAHFTELYNNFDFRSKSFADFLKKAYSEIKKYEKEIARV